MNLKEIKQLAARIRTAALSDDMPTVAGANILIWAGEIESLCEEPEPKLIQERADVGNLVEKFWPDAPQEIKSKIMGPINGTDWHGEPVEEIEKMILRAKAEYQDQPYTFGNNPPKIGKR